MKAFPFRSNPVAFKVLRSRCESEGIACELKAVTIDLIAQRSKSEQKTANLYHLPFNFRGLAIKSQAKK